MNEEQKKDFMEHLKVHEAAEAEQKKHGLVMGKHEKMHDCDVDPNSKSPLASCRLKHPPKDNFQPYVGADDVSGVTKTEDTREVTKSRIHNIYKEELEEVTKYEKELEEKREAEEKKANEKKMSTMNEEQKKDFMEHLKVHEAAEAAQKKKGLVMGKHE